MRLRSRSALHLFALLAMVVLVSVLASPQGGSTGVPPRPPVGHKVEAPGRPTTHIPRPIPPPNP